MTNRNCCKEKLLYKSFALVFMETFTSDAVETSLKQDSKLYLEAKRSNKQENCFLQHVKDDFIDSQIFTSNINFEERYNLKGFNISFTIDYNQKQKEDTEENRKEYTEPIYVDGEVIVKAVSFFDKTLLISYRLIVNKIENTDSEGNPIPIISPINISSEFIDTDDLISLGGLFQDLEFWVYDKEKNEQRIGGFLKDISFTNVPLDTDGKYIEQPDSFTAPDFRAVSTRYTKHFTKVQNIYNIHITKHTYIDIWEDIAHESNDGNNNYFKTLDDPEIIEHIETKHQPELIGIMSSYPREWEYRMMDSFRDICGNNLAIDTDDLVLSNANFTLVFGTYGLRDDTNDSVDWKTHLLQRDRYNVSWPEFLSLVEIALASKNIINYVWDKYSSCIVKLNETEPNSLQSQIRENAQLSIKMSYKLMKLDDIRYLRYISHKHMMSRLYQTLCINEQRKKLDDVIKQLDRSLNNSNNMIEIKGSNQTRNILWYISIASLFGVLLQGTEVETVTELIDKKSGINIGIILNFLTAIGILIGLGYLCAMLYKSNKKRVGRWISEIFNSIKNYFNADNKIQ